MMVTFLPLKQAREKLSNFAQFLLSESKFDHLIPYVNESKLLREFLDRIL